MLLQRERESCCVTTAQWEQKSRFSIRLPLTTKPQAIQCCWAGVGVLAPHVVSSDSWEDIVLLLLGESRSPSSSIVSSDTTPARTGRKVCYLQVRVEVQVPHVASTGAVVLVGIKFWLSMWSFLIRAGWDCYAFAQPGEDRSLAYPLTWLPTYFTWHVCGQSHSFFLWCLLR